MGSVGTGIRQVPWPRVAQVAWLAMLAFVVYILAARTQWGLEQARHICVEPHCRPGETTSVHVRMLRNLGLPVDFLGIYNAVLGILFEASFILVGGLLIWRKASDRMAAFGAFTLLLMGGIAASSDPKFPPSIAGHTLFIANVLAGVGQGMLFVFFYLFPDGRLVRPRLGLLLIVLTALQQLPLPPPPPGPIGLLGLPIFFGPFAIVISMQIYRFRQVDSPAQRQQTKWIVYGLTAGIIGFLATAALSNLSVAQTTFVPVLLVTFFLYAFFALIPLSIGFALLRYRLWDVDVLVNRTLVYGPLTACLAGCYALAVVALQALFRTVTGQGSGLAVAISTLGIAALFGPLRRRIQIAIDRRFYRRKYDASRTLSHLSARLRNDVTIEGVTADVVTVVHETMQPAHIGVWLRRDADEAPGS